MWSILLLVVAALAFAFGWRAGTRAALRRPSPLAPEPPKHDALTHVRFDPLATPPPAPKAALAECSPAWRAAMSALGERFVRADVRAVVFVHGTFAGDDPIALARLARTAVGADVERALRRLFKARVDRALGDAANYPPEYVRLFEAAIGGAIPCVPFVWSSENHHLGRAIAAVRLARFTATLAPIDEQRGRVLFLGHSHAAQVFAMATHLLEGGQAARAIAEAARACGEPIGDLDHALARVRAMSLDFATFGAPVRCAWAGPPNVRAMHVIHRRGRARRVRSIRALFRGHDHDAVQWIGGAGSDFPPISSRDRRAGAPLEAMFGRGADPAAWIDGVHASSHLAKDGPTILVDYGEDHPARGAPKTLFGHAVYTRVESMLFNARLVADRFYPERERRSLPAA